MCLAIPGLIETRFEENGLLWAKVNFGGVKRKVCLQYVPEATEGQYVLVHVGFALSIIDELEAQRALSFITIEAELGEDG